jgi:L-galactose dehydrogenase
MEYRRLGKTEFKVSVLSLGTGGHSRIGQSTGRSTDQSVRIIQEAIENGINLIDSSEIYGTEELVGKAISGYDRSKLYISTKIDIHTPSGTKGYDELFKSLEGSLKRLGTDYIDIYHLHGIFPEEFDHCTDKLLPAMQKAKEEGLIRAIGITERFEWDPSHVMLKKAVADDFFDDIMVGFNILNQSAGKSILPEAIKRNIGILDMFAVRRALINEQSLKKELSLLIEKGLINRDEIDPTGTLILRDTDAKELPEAAYRFCLDEPGIHSVLFGTGNMEHLHSNIEYMEKGPLPKKARDRIMHIFRKVDCISGD